MAGGGADHHRCVPTARVYCGLSQVPQGEEHAKSIGAALPAEHLPESDFAAGHPCVVTIL